MSTLVPVEIIEKHIISMRGQKVMLSADLAELYGVEPKALVQAVKRNIKRFPEDFMFALDREEIMRISQFVISSLYMPDFVLCLMSQFTISSLEVTNWYLHFIQVDDIYLLIPEDLPDNRPCPG